MTKSIRLSLLGLAGISAIAGAQQRPPIRQLGAVSAKAAETFAGNANVRALSNGSLLVNDAAGRRVLLFDPSLGKTTIVADTTPATANAYGSGNASLVAYRGDTTLFIDAQSQSMLVIDPTGKIGKVLAIPRAEDAISIGGAFGGTMYDGQGHLVYRAFPRFTFNRPPGGGGGTSGFTMPTPPDSSLIFRVDLATRKVDTIGYVRTPRIKLETKTDDKGNMSMTSLINPLPVVDEWVVTSDGAIAFVRGSDYHIDWVKPDGTRASSAKIPYDWQRLSDDDKVAFIDSVKAARERLGANAPLPVLGGGGGGGGGGAAIGGGAPQIQIFRGPGGPGGGPGGGGPAGGPQFNFIPASELPDYKPVFFAGALKADNDGNVWIRTTPAVAGGPVYDVVNRKGELIDRVQIPVGRTIAGFGPNGTVYLLERTSPTGPATLERATLR